MGKFKIDYINKKIIIRGDYLPYELTDFLDDNMHIDHNVFHVEHIKESPNAGDILFPSDQKNTTN